MREGQAVPAEVLILGPVAVRSGSEVVAPGSRVVRTVLGVLAALGESGCGAAALADAVWGERSMSGSSLSVAVHRTRAWLREVAGDAVQIAGTANGYALRGAVDADRFARLVAGADGLPAAARAAALADAVALWRAEPLAGVAVGELLTPVVAGLARGHLAAVGGYGRALLADGQAERAVAVVAPEADRHPLDEQLQAVLVQALAVTGQQAAALARYEQVRARLADELGVDPGRELATALLRVLRQDLPEPAVPDPAVPDPTAPDPAAPDPAASRPAPVPGQLPPRVAGFTGRARELGELDAVLADPGAAACCVLTGIGGVGKTSLAVWWAHAVAERFPDGQLYLDLRGYSMAEPVRPAEALGRFLRSFGVASDRVPADQDEAAALYRTVLTGKRVLVLLDNAVDAEQVRPLLPAAPGCLAVVTSRDRLDGLVAREGASRLALAVLPPAEAADLLRTVLGGARVAAEEGAAAELARLCGYLPLGLRIVAAVLLGQPGLPLAEQAAILRRDRLDGLDVAEADPALSVRAAFGLSYDRLATPDQRLFRLLGVLPGSSVTVPAAAVLAGAPEPATRRALRRLVAAHLLRQDGDRYAFHDLLGEFARERAAGTDPAAERAAALTRAAWWYLATADGAARTLSSGAELPAPPEPGLAAMPMPDGESALRWLEAELVNLVAVVRHTAEHGPYEYAWLLSNALRSLFIDCGHPAQWRATAEAAALAADRAGDPYGQALTHLALAHCHNMVGSGAAAAEHFQLTIEASRRAGWPIGEYRALNGLATNAATGQDLLGAVELFAAAAEHARRHGHRRGELEAMSNLGTAYQAVGRLEEALVLLREVYEEYRQLGSERGAAGALESIGYTCTQLGRFDQAREALLTALEVNRRIGRSRRVGTTLENLAALECAEGHLDAARAAAEEAWALAAPTDDRRLQAQLLVVFGQIAAAAGDPARAVGHYERAAAISNVKADGEVEAIALVGLAGCQHQVGQRAKAMAYAQGGLALARQLGLRVVEADALAVLAESHLGAGRPDRALAPAEQAAAIVADCGARPRRTALRRLLGQIRQAAAGTPVTGRPRRAVVGS